MLRSIKIEMPGFASPTIQGRRAVKFVFIGSFTKPAVPLILLSVDKGETNDEA
jgi:hypothetical protein